MEDNFPSFQRNKNNRDISPRSEVRMNVGGVLKETDNFIKGPVRDYRNVDGPVMCSTGQFLKSDGLVDIPISIAKIQESTNSSKWKRGSGKILVNRGKGKQDQIYTRKRRTTDMMGTL